MTQQHRILTTVEIHIPVNIILKTDFLKYLLSAVDVFTENSLGFSLQISTNLIFFSSGLAALTKVFTLLLRCKYSLKFTYNFPIL